MILAVTALVAARPAPRLGVGAPLRLDARPDRARCGAGAFDRAAAMGAADRDDRGAAASRGLPRMPRLPPAGGSDVRQRRREATSRNDVRPSANDGSQSPGRSRRRCQFDVAQLAQAARRSPWSAIALLAWIAGAALVLGRMFLGLAAVLWMSRRTPVVTDAPWLGAGAGARRGSRAVARPLPAQRRVDDADGVGHLPAVGADAGRRRHVAGAPAARRAAPRAGAREAPRLPHAPRRADRVRGLLVQSARMDGGAPPAHRARARLRRSRARLGHARLRLRRPAARHRPRDARRAASPPCWPAPAWRWRSARSSKDG